MTSAMVYHSGLTFATLVVQCVMAQAISLPSVAPRRQGAKKGGGEDPPDAPDTDPAPPATTHPVTTAPAPSHTSSSSFSSTSHSHTIGSSSGLSSGTTSGSTSASSSSGSSTSPSPTVAPVIASAIRSNISTPGIVGAVIGSVILAGLIFMLLAKCIHRAHKARKRPRGFLPLTAFFAGTPPKTQLPTTEMSQTHSSPLISSAVAAGATSSPNPIFTRYSRSFSTSATSSLSPLVPAASLQHSHSIGSSSGQSTAHTRATADLDILQTPPGSPHVGGLLPIISAAASGSASASRAIEPESSPLHRAMTLHQKALETDTKGHEEEGTIEIDKIEGVNDPPPGYND